MSLQTHNQQIKTQDNGGTWVLARSTKVNGKESYFTDSVISLNLPYSQHAVFTQMFPKFEIQKHSKHDKHNII